MRKEKADWLFRSKVSELNPDAEILEDYKDCRTKIKVKCKLCGLEYYDLPLNILSGKLHKRTSGKLDGCRWCRHWHHNKHQQRNILNKLNYICKKINDIEFMEPYDPVTSQIKCKCKMCGNVFYESLDNLYSLDYSCKECNDFNSNCRNAMPKQSMKMQRLNLIFKNSKGIQMLAKDKSNIQCKCDNCGETFTVTGYMKRKKISCPYCYREKRNARKRDKRFEKIISDKTSNSTASSK